MTSIIPRHVLDRMDPGWARPKLVNVRTNGVYMTAEMPAVVYVQISVNIDDWLGGPDGKALHTRPLRRQLRRLPWKLP